MSLSLVHNLSPYPHWEYLSFDTGDRLKIVPERGGLITSWICNGRELLYLDHLRFKDWTKSIRGGIPVLFPICGELPDDKYLLENKEYFLKQHGFARDASWQLNTLDDKSGILLSLHQTKQSLLSFPFHFHLEMEIRLESNSLNILSDFILNKASES